MLYEYMKEFGYRDKDIEKIINTYGLRLYTEECMLRKIKEFYDYFSNLGYSQEEFIKVTVKCPRIFSYTVDNLKKKMDDMVELGYDRKDVIKMMKMFPQLYGLSIEYFKQRIDDMIGLGYTNKDIIKITKYFPRLYSHSIDNMCDKINELIKLGYTKENIISMTVIQPNIYSYSIDSIKKKIDDMVELGFDYKDVIEMTRKFPSLYNATIDNIRRKKEFYDMVGLTNIFIINPMLTIPSIELSYARYMFLQSMGIEIDMSNYKLLFYSQKQFVNRFGIDNKELIELYNYQEYLDNRDKDSKRLVLE